MKLKINFEDTAVAFADKSDFELTRTRWLFASMNYPLVSAMGIFFTRLLLAIRFPVVSIIKQTIFAQFCGGVSLDDSHRTVEKLAASNIKTILDYSVEGEDSEEGFDKNKNEILASIQMAKSSEFIPAGVFKPTGLCSFDLLAKKQSGEQLSAQEQSAWKAFEIRVEEICSAAVTAHRFIYVDAEETWIQDVVDALVLDMMAKFNRERVHLFNTYQMYRKDSLDRLRQDLKTARQNGFKVGAKLVRGAYLEKERERALDLGYADPIQTSKEATDQDFDKALQFCIEHLDDMAVCAGTHNEQSCRWLAQLMDSHGIKKTDDRVYFAQLFGMSDNISYTMASQGYHVAKYVPYGPVRKVMPYMMRRAEENTAMAGQSSREYIMVKKEIARRRNARK